MSTSMTDLANTIETMVVPGKGILAADESTGTIGKRFANIKVENTEENRRAYRSMLFSTPGLNEYINGVILYEETFDQVDEHQVPLAEVLAKQGIVPGIKLDKGLINLANTEGEKVTQGLDGLAERVLHFRNKGARFAKWRSVFTIADETPTLAAVRSNVECLARYAAICQELGVVPIVEPEILIDGDHSIDQCAEVTEIILHELFAALFLHQVELESTILKPSMVLPGISCDDQSNPEEIAEYTLNVFRNNVPAALPTINFLSGGQTPQQATENLNAINAVGPQPWLLSFSYGRALQEPCLSAWVGKEANKQAAQNALLKRAKLNSAASMGEYLKNQE